MRAAANARPLGPPWAALGQTLRACTVRPSRTQSRRPLGPLSTAFMRQEAEDTVIAYFAVLNSGNLDCLHRILAPAVTYSDRCVLLLQRPLVVGPTRYSWRGTRLLATQSRPAPPRPACRVWSSRSLRGLESVSRVLRERLAGYPDITYCVESVMCDRVRAAAHWSCTATNFGSVAGDAPASGRRSQFSGVSLFEFGGDGKIEDVVVYRQGTEDERAFLRLCDLEDDS